MDRYHIAWREEFSVGFESIDAQHKRLIELIGSIPEHDNKCDDALINEVLQYAADHFPAEEDFMASICYPELRKHQNEHKTLTRTLLAYKKQYDEGEKDLYSFKHFMFRWVRDHIMDEDMKIGLFVHQAAKVNPAKPLTAAE